MNLGNPVQDFAGLAVHDYHPASGIERAGECVQRIAPVHFSQLHLDLFQVLAAFLKDPAAREVPGLLVAGWGSLGEEGEDVPRFVQALVKAHKRLPMLRALFLGEQTDEQEASYACHLGDLSTLLGAYPTLQHLRLRGCRDLSLGQPFRHASLRSLILESCGLSETVIREVARAELPLLEHLELWLGSQDQGGADPEECRAILNARRFPRLRHLGLRNSHEADAAAHYAAQGSLLQDLKVLDLSLGNLSDEGGRDLVFSPWLDFLERLDLRHHYLSDNMAWRLGRLKPFVDLRWPQGATVSDNDRVHAVWASVDAGLVGPPDDVIEAPRLPDLDPEQADDWQRRRMRHLDGFAHWRANRWRSDADFE